MRLVPVKDPAAGTNTAAHSPTGPGVAGRVQVTIAPEKRQLIGMATSVVESRDLSRTLRTTASIVHDETRLVRVAPRFAGWVRSLQVNATGQAVAKGQPLFTVYSPELFTAENEYMLTLRNYRLLTNSPAAQQEAAKSLVDSARRRLELFLLGTEEIEALEKGKLPNDELQIRAPASGHVVAKTAVAGKAFMAGETLYELADLTHLWVRAYVYEHDLPHVAIGQKARVIFPYLGSKAFESAVTFIYPHIDPHSRRAEIRLELDNPHHELRLDMWANVEIDSHQEQVLAIPASAVIDSGTRHIAFVDGANEHLEPREIKVGIKTDDYYQVLEGVKSGERVVTRALFLVDSESQLKAAISGMDAAGGHQH
jgi:Cu(I)/Ag(I) efflux system membrane fusion protein